LALLLAFLYVELELLGLLLVIIPLFFVRHTNQINRQLEQANRDLLELMVKAIEARDPYTSGHSQRVAKIAGELAREVGVGFRDVEGITTAALLHDVGKIYEEFAPLLRKEGKLTEHERFVMESHPARSSELVSTISNLRGYVERCVRHHHENYDGSGYPLGLSDDEIPLGARIIMIADTTDAMTTDRPYRSALSYERVVAELDRYAGAQFDPELVKVFKRSAAIRSIVSNRGRPTAPSMKSQASKWRLRVAK
jgi:putative nucleotidyltransferase with HDIG domain